jgi:LPS-assembly protein
MTGFPRPGLSRTASAAGALLLAAILAAPGTGTAETTQRIGADRNAPMVFQADEVQNDDQLGLTVARGHVEISQNHEVLLADTVSYNQRTDTVTASGHVSLLHPTGEVVFADYMELRDSMNNGFATRVRMLLSDRSRLAANAARRVNGNLIQLRRGVYSPCDLCKDDPTKPPAWQIKARQIDDDRSAQTVEFRDTTLEIDGFPVFYTPYLSTPDPSVKRASGFLMPSFGNGNNTGFHFSIPYYWVLDSDKDLTLAPRYNTIAGPLLAGEYRQRFGNGALDAIASVNYSNVGSQGIEDTGDKLRGHINATAVWDLDPTYRTGFNLQRVSDQTYLLRFNFGNPLLNTMITRGYLEGFDRRGETDVNAYLFQPLQPGIGDSTQPIVLPVANRTWQMEPDGWGGILKLNANLLNIFREVGTQTRRLSLGSEWDKTFRDGIGSQYKFIASVRGDAYSIGNLSPLSNPDLPSRYFSINGAPPAQPIAQNYVTGRLYPQVGMLWNYPLVHRGETMTALIEPIVGAFVAPSGGNSWRIPDEDSINFQFRDSDLFRPDRFSGYDLIDTGQRVDYGLKAGIYNKDGGSYRMLIGQSLRAQTNHYLPPGSGAEDNLSDLVGRFEASPTSYLDLIYRFRLDKATLGNRSQEIGANFGPQNLRFGVSYLLMPAEQLNQVVTNPATGQTVLYGKRQQLTLNLTTKLTRYWTLRGSETINLTNSDNIVNGIATPQSSSTSVYANISAIYQDECMAFVTSLTQSGIRSGDVTPGVSLVFSVVFKNLGEIGTTLAQVGGNGS